MPTYCPHTMMRRGKMQHLQAVSSGDDMMENHVWTVFARAISDIYPCSKGPARATLRTHTRPHAREIDPGRPKTTPQGKTRGSPSAPRSRAKRTLPTSGPLRKSWRRQIFQGSKPSDLAHWNAPRCPCRTRPCVRRGFRGPALGAPPRAVRPRQGRARNSQAVRCEVIR